MPVLLLPPLAKNMKWPLPAVGRGLGISVKSFPKNSSAGSLGRIRAGGLGGRDLSRMRLRQSLAKGMAGMGPTLDECSEQEP